MAHNDFDWMHEVQDFSNRLKNYFEDFDRPAQSAESTEGTTAFSPAADLILTDEAFLIDVEVPGMRKEDILITKVGNAIEVSGEKKASSSDGAKLLSGGRKYGAFRKQIGLPQGVEVNMDKAAASYENGVLRITLPKREKDPGTSIPIG